MARVSYSRTRDTNCLHGRRRRRRRHRRGHGGRSKRRVRPPDIARQLNANAFPLPVTCHNHMTLRTYGKRRMQEHYPADLTTSRGNTE